MHAHLVSGYGEIDNLKVGLQSMAYEDGARVNELPELEITPLEGLEVAARSVDKV